VDIFEIAKKKSLACECAHGDASLSEGGRGGQIDGADWNAAPLYEVAHSYAAHPTVALCHPSCMDEMPRIAKQMRGMFAILLNLEHLPCDLSRRMLDTISGIAYGMDYKMTQVSSYSYLILPQSVELIDGESHLQF
jgi:FtsZ-interacting cell division protein YlmF